MTPPPVGSRGAQHGTRSFYVYYGCRCDACRAANTRYTGEHAKRGRPSRPLVSAEPTQVRMRQLRAIGIRPSDVAEMLGYKGHYPPFLANDTITERNEERVRIVHEFFIGRQMKEVRPMNGGSGASVAE